MKEYWSGQWLIVYYEGIPDKFRTRLFSDKEKATKFYEKLISNKSYVVLNFYEERHILNEQETIFIDLN